MRWLPICTLTSCALAVGGVVACSAAPQAKPDSTLLRGGFDFNSPITSANRRISGIQRVAPDRITTLRARSLGAERVGRFVVRQGDNPVDHNDRAEIVFDTNESEGDQGWYEWRTRLGKTFPVNAEWQVLAQFHAEAGGTQPPVSFTVGSGALRMSVLADNYYTRVYGAPIRARTNQWYDMRIYVRWSSNVRVGYVDTWVNGKKIGRLRGATLLPGQTNYMKIGYYRARDIPGTAVVFHSDLRWKIRRA